MDLTTVILIATVIAAIVFSVVEVVKVTLNVSKRYLPVTALIVGLLIGVAALPITDFSVYELLWGGGLAGLSASGFFDLTQCMKKVGNK